MTTIVEDQVEAIFAELLAEVLRVERVPVESHFFDDLGADSLVMAHFCARVRKRGDLPPVSTPIEAPTPTTTREYVLCGALQALFFLAYSYVAVIAVAAGFEWVSAASSAVDGYLRFVLVGGARLVVV